MNMKTFSVSIDICSDEDEDSDFPDAAVDVELPDGVTVDHDQLATLTKRIAGVVGDFIRDQYKDADVTVCT